MKKSKNQKKKKNKHMKKKKKTNKENAYEPKITKKFNVPTTIIDKTEALN